MAIGTTNFPTALDTATELVEVTNNASSALTSAITNSQTTITVNDPGEFASSGFATIVDDLTTPTKIEVISYTGKSGSDLTGVTRGAQGTSAQAFSTGYVECRYTKGTHEALRGAIIAVETKLGYGSDTAANGQVLIGNGTGTSEWRALIAGDIPDLSGTYQPVDADLTAIAALSADGFLKKTGGTWGMDSTAYGTGTVTSVALSLPAILSVSGSPITTSGTFTVTLADQAANAVLAGPTTGAATTPAFRALVAADIPGVLSLTKASNLTSNGFVKTSGGDGTLSVDTSTYLTANQTVTLSGDVTGSGSTAITTTIASASVTYAKIQNVSATSRILGRKTTGAGSAEECTLSEILDFVGSAAQGDILYRDASGWARLGAGTSGHYLQTQGAGANPQWAAAAGGGGGITVGTTTITSGTAGRILYETSGNVVGEIAGSSADSNGAVQWAATARTSGVAQYFRVNTPADTGMTASTQSVGIYFGGDGSGSTVTRQWSAGALTTQREYVFVPPTYAFAGASTLTTAVTLDIPDSPTAGTNATITTPIAARIASTATGSMAMHIIGPATGSTSAPMLRIDGTSGSVGGNYPTLAILGAGGSHGGPRIFLGNANGGTNFDFQAQWGAITIRQATLGNVASGLVGTIGLAGWTIGAASAYAQLYAVSLSASRVGLRVDSAASPSTDVVQFTLNGTNAWQLSSTGTLTQTAAVANTATIAIVGTVIANSTGTAATGFGLTQIAQLESSTTNAQDASAFTTLWTDATHASRTSSLQLQTVSNASSLTTRLAIAGRKALTDASAVSLFDATCASNSACGGTIEATIIATDGTDYQTRSVILTYQAVNKAGTITSSITVASETAAVSTGTLTGTWSVSNGTGKITIQLNADSSLTPTTFFVMYQVKNNCEQAITIL